MRIRFHRCVRKWLGLLVVIVAIVVLSTLYYNRVYKSHVDSAVVVISSDQLMINDERSVRQWTKTLMAGSDLNMKSDHRLQEHDRYWNITLLENVHHRMMPAERGMPIEKAELNFHEYVSQVHVECKHPSRIGNVSDGGWDICLSPPFQLVQPCLVYSFGIGDNWSFDDGVAAKYGCVVRAFDPSINKRDHIRGDLIWFYAVGIGKENTQHLQYGWPLNTFSALISKCHDENKTIDILKLDVESSEWGALETMLKEGTLHHVKQLAIEIHTPEMVKLKSSIDDLVRYSTILHQLELIGFRKWHWNFNVWGFFPALDGSKYLSCCYELGYININYV